METIFALSTASGRAGVAVIRISGPAAVDVAEGLCGSVPAVRGLRQLRREGVVLDEALVLNFAEGHSFTGEAVVELQVHGSMAVVSAVLHALGTHPSARPAEAGEFTRRAMDNGRLDLTQAEGLADLLEAETEAQRQQALGLMQGALSLRVAEWRSELTAALALIAAQIDFSDEDDVSPALIGELARRLEAVSAMLSRELAGFGAAARVRHGFEVAVIGPPNVGKSTLINRLAGRDVAMTSDLAGTTRDVLEVSCEIGGQAVTFLDTAGLRETSDQLEAMGIARGQDRANRAQLRIFLVEEGQAPPQDLGSDDLWYWAKGDSGGAQRVSGKTGEGVEALVGAVSARLARWASGAGLLVRERHHHAVTSAREALETALLLLRAPDPALELVGHAVQEAVRGLDILTGRIDVEDVLADVFGRFCIGK